MMGQWEWENRGARVVGCVKSRTRKQTQPGEEWWEWRKRTWADQKENRKEKQILTCSSTLQPNSISNTFSHFR